MPGGRTRPCQIEVHADRWGEAGKHLRERIPEMVQRAGGPLKELSVVLVGDAGISRLHQQFFEDASTTDVITFPLELDSRGRAVSGEVYLCVPMARREAKRRGLPLEHELLLYALHGILHLAGYDDLTDAGYKAMHKKEDAILKAMGIGAVFAPAARKPAG